MSGSLKIKKITFKTGKTPASSPASVNLSDITVIVGPNSSGKSQALSEIESFCLGKPIDFKVVNEIEIEFPSNVDEVISILQPFMLPANPDQPDIINLLPQRLVDNHDIPKPRGFTKEQMQEYLDKSHDLRYNIITNPHVIKLNGPTRFSLLQNQQKSQNPDRPASYIDTLFHNRNKRKKIQQLTFNEFGQYVVIDHFNERSYTLKMSSVEPLPEVEENSRGF